MGLFSGGKGQANSGPCHSLKMLNSSTPGDLLILSESLLNGKLGRPLYCIIPPRPQAQGSASQGQCLPVLGPPYTDPDYTLKTTRDSFLGSIRADPRWAGRWHGQEELLSAVVNTQNFGYKEELSQGLS